MDHNTGECVRYSLRTVCGFSNLSQNLYVQRLWDGAYGLSSLAEKTKKCNLLHMSFQRRLFLLSYLKTLSWGPPARQTGAYPIQLIWQRLILKLTVWTRECENSFSVRIGFWPCKVILLTLEWLPRQQESKTKGNNNKADYGKIIRTSN